MFLPPQKRFAQPPPLTEAEAETGGQIKEDPEPETEKESEACVDSDRLETENTALTEEAGADLLETEAAGTEESSQGNGAEESSQDNGAEESSQTGEAE